jgi:hypothetical protein
MEFAASFLGFSSSTLGKPTAFAYDQREPSFSVKIAELPPNLQVRSDSHEFLLVLIVACAKTLAVSIGDY